MQEFEHNPLKQDQGLTATREWLGKPVFPDQKKGRKQASQLVSRTIEGFLQIGEKVIVAGAELGAEKYKRMYPIAERVLSSSS